MCVHVCACGSFLMKLSILPKLKSQTVGTWHWSLHKSDISDKFWALSSGNSQPENKWEILILGSHNWECLRMSVWLVKPNTKSLRVILSSNSHEMCFDIISLKRELQRVTSFWPAWCRKANPCLHFKKIWLLQYIIHSLQKKPEQICSKTQTCSSSFGQTLLASSRWTL